MLKKSNKKTRKYNKVTMLGISLLSSFTECSGDYNKCTGPYRICPGTYTLC